ncbi:hypothetical protein [Streptomyces sp. A1136]|uniref:hypothetical protein n=1 Tax=Streptomyces sp. A1136 TaxID=2563102 RepID=UPI00109ECF46|nr:hypothetical protein [Streptomyces sp. A1136]THA54193.1 hypothetical protein E6R62_16610 [Streptomyces sp. A1136]
MLRDRPGLRMPVVGRRWPYTRCGQGHNHGNRADRNRADRNRADRNRADRGRPAAGRGGAAFRR